MTVGSPGIEAVVRLALTEDLGRGVERGAGDVTSAATVAADATAAGRFVTREPGVVAGLDAVRAVFDAVDARLTLTRLAADGDRVAAGDVVAEAGGPARSLLAAERTALNLLTHLSGVASETARYVEAVAGTGCLVRDSRKTLPGLRAAQKRAVAAGGGRNHRAGLYDGLLVKDNHAAAAGGVAAATRRALDAAGGLPVQIEVDTLAELDEALAAGATAVLCDNFPLPDLRTAVDRCRRAPEPVFVEASGGLGLETVGAVADTGVDAVAVGALTHSVRALDIGLDFL